MIKFPRGFGALGVAFGALALTVSASGQGYPPTYPPPSYPAPASPGQRYPAYPAQTYPAQTYPAQTYPGQGYPGQGYPQPSYPAQSNAVPNAANQQGSASPTCVRLQTQLAALTSGAANSPLDDQIKRAEDAIAKQQADLDRSLAQARKEGCGQGFFSLFSGFSPQCGPLNSKIDEMRSNLDRMMSDLEQLKSGNNDQEAQRASLIGQLAQNNCGSQYTAAARAAGPQGFFEALLGGGTVVSPGGNGAPAGTYRTVCVRACDGFYFPISYSTVPARFAADAQTCQRLCPAAQVMLYTYRNPGEEIEQAVSADGAPYTALPNAFRYRKELVAGCSCRQPGQTWAEALRNADDSSTLESTDIVVTDQNEKALTRVPQAAPGKTKGAAGAPSAGAAPTQQDAGSANAPSGADTGDAVVTDSNHRKVRVVGPPFLSQQ